MKRFLFLPRGCAFILAALCAGGGPSFGQSTFEKIYGGHYGESVQQTSDGGYIITGSTAPFTASLQGYSDICLIKTNSMGDTLWTRTYGGDGDDAGESVQQTSDGGYVVAGILSLNIGDYSGYVYLLKTNSNGDTLWTRTYGRGSSAASVQQTSDGGYVIAGSHTVNPQNGNSVGYLVKTDSSGAMLWQRSYKVASWHTYMFFTFFTSAQQTSDGGYIIAGGSLFSDYGACLLKVDSQGDTLWTKKCASSDCRASSVQQTSDGGYVVAGNSLSSDTTSAHMLLTKTDPSGEILWTRTYGDSASAYGYSVRETFDGGYVIAGQWSASPSWTDDRKDAYLVKTDSSGDTLWTRTYGGARRDGGSSCQQTSDGGYIIVGSSSSCSADGATRVYLIKTQPDGLLDAPDPPTLCQPNDGAKDLSTSLRLGWLWCPRARYYRMQIALDSSFRTLIVADSTTDSTAKAVSGLVYNSQYYWRVSAMNTGGTSTWSQVWRFDTMLDLPAAVTLVSPEDKATVKKDSVRFIWRSGTPSVQRYAWELAADSLFGSSVVDSLIADTSKVLCALPGGQTFWWRVAAKNALGWGQFSQRNRFTTRLTAVSEQWEIPLEFSLGQNYPNPFNPSTTIRYGLPQRSHVTLTVFNILGQQVATLVNGDNNAGYHEVQFDGSGFSSGVYLYMIQAAHFIQTRKLLLVR